MKLNLGKYIFSILIVLQISAKIEIINSKIQLKCVVLSEITKRVQTAKRQVVVQEKALAVPTPRGSH